jgi:ferric-dicitrate binding protein FerR (iron transport regulator)
MIIPKTGQTAPLWGEQALALATDIRNNAAKTVVRAKDRIAVAEADLSLARSAEASARKSGHTDAASVAREAVAVAEEDMQLAHQYLKNASSFLAEREKVLADVQKNVSAQNDATRGIIVPEKGDVRRFAADGTPLTDFSRPLRAGERITTDAGGQARLFLSKGDAEVELQGSSSLSIQQDDDKGFLAGLDDGIARFNARLKAWANKKFAVRTPTAVLAVRGTEFIVTSRGDKTTVQVLAGNVYVTPSGGKGAITLMAGESATVTPEGIANADSLKGDGNVPTH